MQYDLTELGKRIQKTRKELKISQKQLAERIHRKREFISNIENGKSEPTLSDLFGMCELFQCELGYLLGDPEYKNKTRATTDFCRATGLSEKAVNKLIHSYQYQVACNIESLKYGKIEISVNHEPRRDFINYFIENGLNEIALSVESLAVSPNSETNKAYFSLPEELRDVIETRAQLNTREGGCFDNYAMFIIDVNNLIANEDTGAQIIKQCQELSETDLFRTESEYITENSQNQINRERVAETYRYIKTLKENDPVSDPIYGFDLANEEDLFTVCRVAFVCGYDYTIKKITDPVKRFIISDRFNQIVNDYTASKRE